MRRAREMKSRLARGRGLETLLERPMQEKDFSREFKEFDTKIEDVRIKTLAAARPGQMEKVKDELRAMLPILKPSEVRRFRLSLHEAIIDELEESSYEESICYLKELFELDEATCRETGILTWKKPRLKDNRDAMLRLKEGLITVERAKNAGDYVSTVVEFLNMALFFQAMSQEWWWVAKRLYCSALDNAKLIKLDDQRTSTFAHYLYGRFLFEQIQDTVESVYHLKIAREASQEKSWNASMMTGRKEETIFRECNVLLYKALLMYAQQIGPDQPDITVKAYTEALARATESEHHEFVANVLYELGMSQLRSGDVKHAFQNFSKFLAMTKRISDPEGICNAHMAMALAYKLRELGDDVNTEKYLRLFIENATESGFTRKLAQAHFCTGEHFLSKRKLDIATFHLEKSFELYNEAGLYNDADKARALAGVSKGQEIIDQYVHLIHQCGAGDPKAIMALCQWKNRRSIFWTEKEEKLRNDRRQYSTINQ